MKPCRGIAARSDEKATTNPARRHIITDVCLWPTGDPNEITYLTTYSPSTTHSIDPNAVPFGEFTREYLIEETEAPQ